MKFITNGILFVFLICQSVTNADIHGFVPSKTKDLTLAQFLFESTDLIQRNPQRSLECFDKYEPIFEEINENYKKGYENCLKAAAEETEAINKLSKQERKEVEERAETICNRLTTCNNEQLAIPFYKCYEEAGGKNIKELYSLSADASEIVDHKNEQLRQIEPNKNTCIKANQRKYDEDLVKVRSDLSNCLQGKEPQPEPTPKPEPPTTPQSEH